MSAAALVVDLHAAAAASAGWFAASPPSRPAAISSIVPAEMRAGDSPIFSLAFYRKHTEKMLRRYLYASMLVGRAPYILKEELNRGLVSSRPVRSFEDAVIFVLDLERCLYELEALDRVLLGKIVLQQYSHEEVSLLLGVSNRFLATRLGLALDRLTRILLEKQLLLLPDRDFR